VAMLRSVQWQHWTGWQQEMPPLGKSQFET
jgi:hypothetical protein